MALSFNTDEVAKVADILAHAADAAPGGVRAVVQKGALNIKTDARRRISGHRRFPAYPASITYDTEFTRLGAAAEIGPDKGKRQGALGNILEYGTTNNAPMPHMRPAAEAEEPRFVKALEDVAVKALEL